MSEIGPLSRKQEKLLELAERAIAATLLKLEEDTGLTVAYVSVDTRNFAHLETQISLTNQGRL